MTGRAPHSMASNNSLVSTIIIYPCGANIPTNKLRFVTPTKGVPFSVNHTSESKISALFPQWFSEQLDNTGFNIMVQ